VKAAVIAPAPRWTWGVTLSALACTLALFLAVPMLETLRKLHPDMMQQVRSLPDLREAPPPPPPMVLPEVTSPQPVAEAIPLPELSLPAPPPPMALTPSLSMPALFTPAQWSTDPLRTGLSAPVAPSLLDISQVDQPPRPRSQLRPLYPPRARLHRIEGWVDLEFTVTREGTVEDVRVLGVEPDESFSRNAVQAAARWTFLPARHQNEAVPVRVRQRITFELQ